MLNRVKDLFPHRLRQKLKRKIFAVRDVDSRLQNLKRAGFAPKGVIDGGAYQGAWTEAFWNVWRIPTLLVEPQDARQDELKQIASVTPGSEVIRCALGSEVGSVSFAMEESNSRIIEGGGGEKVPLCTLAAILESRPAFQPDFVKLDLQGHEIKAMEGAGSHLQRFEVILLEISLIRIGPVPVFREVDCFMAKHGFELYDVIPQYYRPRDGALWQMDAFYVRSDSPLLASTSWD